MQGDQEIVPIGIESQFSAADQIFKERQGAFSRNIQISGQHSIGNDYKRLVGVSAFPDVDLFYISSLAIWACLTAILAI